MCLETGIFYLGKLNRKAVCFHSLSSLPHQELSLQEVRHNRSEGPETDTNTRPHHSRQASGNTHSRRTQLLCFRILLAENFRGRSSTCIHELICTCADVLMVNGPHLFSVAACLIFCSAPVLSRGALTCQSGRAAVLNRPRVAASILSVLWWPLRHCCLSNFHLNRDTKKA